MMIFNPTHWADETHDHLVYKEIYPLSYMVQITIHKTIYTTSKCSWKVQVKATISYKSIKTGTTPGKSSKYKASELRSL